MRRNDDELTETNLKLDQELLNELKRLGVVEHHMASAGSVVWGKAITAA